MEASIFLRNTGLMLLMVCFLWLPSTSSGLSENREPGEYDPGSLRTRYQNWLKNHGRKYKNRDEWLLRFGIYQSNVQFIEFINSLNFPFKLTDNQFADMTNDEFKFKNLGVRISNHTRKNPDHRHINHRDLPTTVDWRKKGAVTPIKNQGQCGSCWAFSAVAAMEGINHIKTGKLVSLSEQELVDCDVNNDNQGCQGGLMEKAFEYTQKIGGLTTEDDYPYKGKDDTCNKAKTQHHAVKITGYETVAPNNETSLQAAVANQPVSVAIDAGGYAFQLYSSGIFTAYCGKELNHGVTAVGYGEEDGKKYWLVKNSWGKEWGESGYIRMVRDSQDKRGICGIAMMPSYPLKD